MGENSNRENSASGVQRGRNNRGRSGWRPNYRRGWNRQMAPPREKSVVLPIPNSLSSNSDVNVGATTSRVAPTNIQPLIFTFLDKDCAFSGWKLYFPQETCTDTSVRKVKAIKKHFQNNRAYYDFDEIQKLYWFPLHLKNLVDDQQFQNEWNSFQQDLIENPEHTLACIGMAMHQLLSGDSGNETTQLNQSGANRNNCLQIVRPRIFGYDHVDNLRSLKVNKYDRLISIRGTIIRAGAIEILCTWMAFRCSSCNSEQCVKQPDGIMTMPNSCKSGCRARSNFTPLLSSAYTRTVQFQILRVQESTTGQQYNSGSGPKIIEVELTEDLVDSVSPGDDITLIGILKVRPQEEIQRKNETSLYKMYIRAISIMSNKNTNSNRKSEFTEKDMQAIKMISEEPCPFRLLVHSLCPAIYGHEMIKAGLILGLFGGSKSETGRRCEAHVLVVGDPGVGKSQMLQACANVSPRGIFVCGNSTSNAGLTATVRHEKGSVGGGGSLEAGALVLADQGVCCIDEFDKMPGNHQSLLEVMEQQTVSVAKAGVLGTLSARTCILAAANPSGGHYVRSKTVSENLKINPAILSRFDLVFILLDRPDEHLDSLLTSHIQALNAGRKKLPNCSSFVGSKENTSNILNTSTRTYEEKPLKERLILNKSEDLDLLPHVLMQRYIGYARKNVHPKLNKDAAGELKNFYLELRRVHSGVDSIPVTTRQLEALIRLTQARARLELSNDATRKHALDVIEIVRYSLVDVFSTDNGTLQMDRQINGSGMSQTAQVKKFLRILQARCASMNKTVFDIKELKEMASFGGISMSFNQLIDSLNIQGILLKKGQSLYKVVID